MISENDLYHDYVDLDLSVKEIAQKRGIAAGTVHNYMVRYGIKARRGVRDSKRDDFLKKLKARPHRSGFHLSDQQKALISEKHKGKMRKPSKYGGHLKKRSDGYVKVYCPGEHGATKDGYKMQHILVAEEMIGRYLKDDEVVHHINHNRSDNRPENLAVMTASEHMRLHMKERWAQKKGVMTY